MRNLLSALFFVLVFVGLGAMAFAAAPRGREATQPAAAPAAAEVQVQESVAPEAAAAANWNIVTMALDSTNTLSNASDLAAEVAGTQTVLHWLPGIQNFDAYPGSDFTLEVGEAYLLLLDSNAPDTFSLVGDVPAQGSVQFSMLGSSPSCMWNIISLPLDQGSITLASELETSIETAAGDTSAVVTILEWLPGIQNFDAYPGSDFAVEIGQDYFLCLTQNVTWPQ